jgi:uncharacterized protein YbcV (DUF1398 family)
MMFTEQQMKDAHSRVKTGADFPAYVQEIRKLGLLRYEFWVSNGHITYHGARDYKIDSAANYETLPVAAQSSANQLKHIISIHQQGQTDFMTFCQQAAQAGVEKWVIDTQTMLCTYYDVQGTPLVAEPIPNAKSY